MTTIRPTQDYVLIQPQKVDERSTGGIIIPDNAKKKPQRGEVLAVGPGLPLDSGGRARMDVAPGDVVLFGECSGRQEVDRETLLIRASEILAVLDPAPETSSSK
jgi:chaperonin GroES